MNGAGGRWLSACRYLRRFLFCEQRRDWSGGDANGCDGGERHGKKRQPWPAAAARAGVADGRRAEGWRLDALTRRLLGGGRRCSVAGVAWAAA